MSISAPFDLTGCRRFFAEPATPRQRQYEALRAFFVEGLASAEVARRFGYSPAGFRMLCYDFRRGELPDFFALTRPGPREQPKKSLAREQAVALRKRNYSIYDISQTLKQQGTPLSATAVREILAEEGFAPLPRRLDEERPASVGPTTEAVADVRSFVLGQREFTTRVGGLFLFVPDLIRLDSDALAENAKLPGSRMIPAGHALRASLALKLWSIERKSHVMALVADEGLALFCGLNAMPKKSFMAEFSSRITPPKVSRLLASWHTQLAGETIHAGESFNLDFHSVPYFGEHPLVESHSSRNSATTSPPSCSPTTQNPPCVSWSCAMPSACSSRTHSPMPCVSSISTRCPHRSASRSISIWRFWSSPAVSIASWAAACVAMTRPRRAKSSVT